jgi:hypothetical protein
MIKTTLLFISLLLYGLAYAQSDTTSFGVEDIKLPTYVMTEADFDGKAENQDISGLLQSSRDIFVSTAGYSFGSVRFRIRGYDSDQTSIMFNGIIMNDPETGRAFWSTWGGLNDATRNIEMSNGIGFADYGFGGIGGISNIVARASTFRKSTNLSYSASNRSYNNRIMVHHATGLMDNGWAVTISGSKRWALESYVKGTYYDAYSYFLSVEKKLNQKHSLGLLAFGAPNERARSSVSTQEAYDLSGSNYYNANWGYQNGEVRNARISSYNQPLVQLAHYWDINNRTSLNSSVHHWFGKGSSTSLEWAEANDPRPDYYRNLPSYWLLIDDLDKYEEVLDQWKNNETYRQIQWDQFYFANSKRLATIENVNGIAGNSVTGFRSKYIVEDRRQDKNQSGFNTNLKHQLNSATMLAAGVNVTISKGRNYKMVSDLLGGDFWLDVDKYADEEPFTSTDESQSDLRFPNRIVKVGDKFGYDYTSNVNKSKVWGQAEWKLSRFDVFAGVELTNTVFWRTGHMQNGKFPDNSLGDSEKNNFFDYALKAGAAYKIDGRNYIVANGAMLTRAPFFQDAYISARTRDFTVPDLKSEGIFSGDLSYVIRAPRLKARATLYYTQLKDELWVRSYYHEDLKTFVNYIMAGINKQHQGAEIGIEANVSPSITLTAVAAHGEYIYTSRPQVTIARDNDAALIAEDRTVYLKNYYVGGTPQTALSAGIKYNSSRFWFAGINGNYYDNNYLEPNADNYTAESMGNYWDGDYRIEKLLTQKKLDPAFTLDFFGGKSWRVDDYYIGLTVSANNLLNSKDIIMWGFEQLRTDLVNPDRFPAKYSYMYGTTYFVNLTIRR